MMYEMNTSGQTNLASLEDYIDAIRSRKWLVASFVALGLLLGYLAATLPTKVFAAEATVLVNPTPVGSVDGRMTPPVLEREIEVIVSDGVAQQAVALLGTNEDPLPLRLDLQAEFVPDSDVIRMEYRSDDAERAASVVNSFSEAYVTQRLADQSGYYDTRAAIVNENISQVNVEIDEIRNSIAVIDEERRSAIASGATGPAQTATLDKLNGDRGQLIAEQNSLIGTRRTLEATLAEITSNRGSSSPAAVVLSAALVPTEPEGLGTTTLIGAGLVFGLLFGAVAAFLAQRLDRSASSADDVSESLEVGIIGSVPDLGWRYRGKAGLVMLSKQRNVKTYQAKEAYRRMRTAIEFLMRSDGIRTLIVTSSHPGEGKSVTSANLAMAIAAGGSPVILVNADMRRPTLEALFGVENSSNGLSTYLGGLGDDFEVHRFDDFPNLVLIPAGPSPANPGELLASSRFRSLLENLSEQADYVIIDTPPLGSTADAAAAAQSVDGVLVVADAKSTSTQELRLARADIDRAGAKIIGAVVNRDNSRESGWLRRRNRYAYASAD